MSDRLREVRASIARRQRDYTIDVVFDELDWMVSEMQRDAEYARVVIGFYFSMEPRVDAIRELRSVAYNRFRNWMDREIRQGHTREDLDLERGAVAVPVNARYQASELSFLLKDADLVALVTTGKVADNLDFGQRLVAALPTLTQAQDAAALALDEAPMLRTIICLDPPCAPYLMSGSGALALGTDVPDQTVDAAIDAVDANDVAMILYTSGTTATPKGALITHRAQVGNSRNLGKRYQVTERDKVWSPAPYFTSRAFCR